MEKNGINTDSTATGLPPDLPWKDLDADQKASSYLCFYYSSPFSSLPVRDVNRVASYSGAYAADNKVDPNWETKTFGLFSTCQDGIRRGIVKGRAPYIFFFGNHVIDGTKRGVTGYYRLKWYADGGTHDGDFCLAADKTHFVERPLSFEFLNMELAVHWTNRAPRLALKVPPDKALHLVELIERQPDCTESYIKEVQRLELVNARNSGGLKYINFSRRDSYSWKAASEITSLGIPSKRKRTKNLETVSEWACELCQATIRSASPLKICPACGAHASLS